MVAMAGCRELSLLVMASLIDACGAQAVKQSRACDSELWPSHACEDGSMEPHVHIYRHEDRTLPEVAK